MRTKSEDSYTMRPISYMDRTRTYYLSLGYGNPYQWAYHREAPFQRLRKPVSSSRIAIVTTAALFQPDKGDQSPTAKYNAAAKFYVAYAATTRVNPDLRISHLTYDRVHTLPDDINAYFPLQRLREAESSGRIGALAPRFFGLPTNRSQATTREHDAPRILQFCREDEVDAVVLVPNCPICHQAVSLTARHLEANGVATIIIGCAKDIPEHCTVPRFVFSDFPLGNSAGRPHDVRSQQLTLDLALSLLDAAQAPRTTVQSPSVWSGKDSWKEDYCSAVGMSEDAIRLRRAEIDEEKRIALQARREQIPHLLAKAASSH